MREDISDALRAIVSPRERDMTNPYNERDRVFAAALLETRAALARIEERIAATTPNAPAPAATRKKKA